ncbi:MAG: secretin N-terminal domain-containing protein [Simkaniaceae bacterium]|nr:secretin N-terminal domain-containing protein [Candidatus Sacchlamyda saccharinae]
MKQIILAIFLAFTSLSFCEEQVHDINFSDVPASEFIRFVSKISEANFIFDHRELGFNVTLSSGKPMTSDQVVQALVQMLRMHGFAVSEEGNYFVVHRYSEQEIKNGAHLQEPTKLDMSKLVAGEIPAGPHSDLEFATYKLRYHQGDDIEGALKKIASDMGSRPGSPRKLLEAIQTIQWVKATNSLFFTGDQETVVSLDKLIKTLDVPRRQVFIEVVVLETDSKKNTEFGLQWVGGGKFKDKIAFGAGNFPGKGSSLAQSAQASNAGGGISGLDQIPLGRGFDLGIIGDIILHKGKTFLTLGSLVSALEADGDSNIVLNQKIITQDNKNSKVFVGDNIPFTGSVVSTVGNSQQTTANIEYRDVGVALSITPMLGEDGVITLDIDQEITEAIDDPMNSATDVEGIRTTKTNMSTLAHVPDDHFLVLSGMGRNARSYQRAGIPCLGGLPVVGAAFSKNKRLSEKRNVLIFVRPHIINSFEDYDRITQSQQDVCKLPQEILNQDET